MAPPTGVTFNPEGGKKRKRKQQVKAAEIAAGAEMEETLDMRDRQEVMDNVTSEEDEVEEVAPRPPPPSPSTSSSSTAAAGKKRKRKQAEVEDEDEDDDEEEIIDMMGSSSKTIPKTKKRRRLMINDSLCFANYNQRFPRAKQHSLIRVGKTGKLEFDFGIGNHDLPSLLSCILTSFNKDPELIQHLKSEPRIVCMIKESFKDLLTNLKA